MLLLMVIGQLFLATILVYTLTYIITGNTSVFSPFIIIMLISLLTLKHREYYFEKQEQSGYGGEEPA